MPRLSTPLITAPCEKGASVLLRSSSFAGSDGRAICCAEKPPAGLSTQSCEARRAKQDKPPPSLISRSFGPLSAREELEKPGMKFWLLENSFVFYQYLIIFLRNKPPILSPTPKASVILSPLPSWDRMITGIREGGRPMAASGIGYPGRAEFP